MNPADLKAEREAARKRRAERDAAALERARQRSEVGEGRRAQLMGWPVRKPTGQKP